MKSKKDKANLGKSHKLRLRGMQTSKCIVWYGKRQKRQKNRQSITGNVEHFGPSEIKAVLFE